AEGRKIDALKASAKRLATWGKVYDSEKFARRARSMEKRVERLVADQTFVSGGSPLELKLELGETRAKQVVAIRNVDINVAGRELFHIDELILRPGERVALLGHNGVGKTTFIRRLVDALAGADDAVRYGPQTSLGYYDQELSEVEGRGTMLEYVRDRTDAGEHAIVQRLIYAGFPYAQHTKRVCEMSGGERARLLFVVLSLNAPNFLVLDEPTNHIDVDGKEQLEEQLLQSDAALLFTSHDRMFIERLAERFLWITEGRLVEIHSLERFLDDTTMSVQSAKIASADLPDGPQDLLARIVELEDLLAADTARKPKFQKPERQTAWQAELQRLNALL
ncbi:MAG: ATP-binding cassette domain-containing protein, partial [Pseudomonadales bacterium]